jgi:hypothetical protein
VILAATRRVLALGAAALLCLLAASCGDVPPDGGDTAVLAGPPLWRDVHEEGRVGDAKLALQCRSPCRVRFRLELPDDARNESPWRVLGAGQTLQIWWSVKPFPEEARGHLAHPGASAGGRTEPHAASVFYQFEDRAFAEREFVSWTRPGRGRLMHVEAVPPGTYDPLPVPGSVELATVAVTDLEKGRATWKRRANRHRLVLPDDRADGDRVRVLRLFLDLEPLDDGR